MSDPVGFLRKPNPYDPRFPDNGYSETYVHIPVYEWGDGSLKLTPEPLESSNDE